MPSSNLKLWHMKSQTSGQICISKAQDLLQVSGATYRLVSRFSVRCWRAWYFSCDLTYLIARGQGPLERRLHLSTFCW